MSERTKRHLAAIVAADVAGYSRLIGVDEEGTLRALREHRIQLINPLLDEHGGRIANTAGDSLLLEFSSVVDAVRCALAIQQGMAARNAQIQEDRQVRFRIGINVGDVIAEGGDLLGDGVNIAARIEGLAEPGSIAISDDAYRQVRDRIQIQWQDGGKQTLKNISRAIRVWRWMRDVTLSVADAPHSLASPPLLPDKPSIAVLPFDNMSGDPEQEYFADGIVEDVITQLSRLRWLFVISRHSSFTYKGQAVGIQTVGQELGVRYVVKGSVRKAGQRVRVTAHLIDARTENQIWGQRYDRELIDIFDLQDELTGAISAQLDSEIAGSERQLSRAKSTFDLGAWDYYQRGMWHLFKMSKSEIAEARLMFEQAIERVPDYANAHAALGYIAAVEALSGYCPDRVSTLTEGLAEAERAVELDDRDSFNHFALGRVCTVLGQQDRAVLALEKSIALNPNSAHANYGLGVALYWNGNAEQALPYLDRSIRLSPQDPHLWTFYFIRGCARYFAGDVQGAISDQRIAIHNKAKEYLPHLALACALLEDQGKFEEAQRAFQEARSLKPELSENFARATIINLHSPYLERLLGALKTLGLPCR